MSEVTTETKVLRRPPSLTRENVKKLISGGFAVADTDKETLTFKMYNGKDTMLVSAYDIFGLTPELIINIINPKGRSSRPPSDKAIEKARKTLEAAGIQLLPGETP